MLNQKIVTLRGDKYIHNHVSSIESDGKCLFKEIIYCVVMTRFATFHLVLKSLDIYFYTCRKFVEWIGQSFLAQTQDQLERLPLEWRRIMDHH